MTKTCPSCDVLAPHDARYCRHCGAPLQRLGAAGDTGANISPIANTVPLSGNNPTDKIVAQNPAPQTAASHTSEVTPEEMYDLWRRGTSAGEARHAEPERPGDGRRSASAREARESHNSAPAHQAGNLQTNSQHVSEDYDPEQTQITIPVRPLTSRNLPADAAAAASVAARANGKPQFNHAPQQVTLSPTGTLLPPTSPSSTAAAAHTPAQPNERRAFRVWLGLAFVSVVVIGCVAAVVWFGLRGFRRTPETPSPAVVAAGGEASAPAVDDPKRLASAKLAEADTLIASGNATEAQARLREAAVLDPSNAEPHHRLARLLLADGSRREAIEELRVVTRLTPANAEAWRALASAQFAEGLYRDALESYRGLGEASPAALARDSVQLAYADTLRLAGRTNEARAIYRRLAETSADAQVAAASKRQLGQPAPSPTSEDAAEADNANTQLADATRPATAEGGTSAATPRNGDANRQPDAPTATPTPAPPTSPAPPRASSGSPSDQYQRGVALWTTNRAAAIAEFRAAAGRGNSDASYYLGLSIAEGRDPRTLKRAELVAALVHFGRARRGKFRGQSVTYEEQLGRELDRRRNQPSQ
ncbi:MAG TPA: tetratricopeptide repeat protein [Pyrinomonadaceae bacterium]|jgi:tetratricopeptide (TPR) repeat protein|nr:tetratricopeptide repeat protein [Pyrinomonadaceae bacterium]